MCSNDGGKSTWLFGDDKWEMQKAIRNLSESDSRFGSEVIQDFYPPPNYHGDHNVIQEVISKLTPEQLDQFATELTTIVLKRPRNGWWDLNASEVGSITTATASQKSEALLRIIARGEEQ
jgi:hypothetical protein